MSWARLNQARRFMRVSIWRTLFFNFNMLPFRQAVKFPVILTSNTYFYSLRGKLKLTSPVRMGMVRFGFFGEDTIHAKSNKTILQIDGTLELAEDVHFGNGITIRVSPKAVLSIDHNVKISNRTKIICYDNIHIGADTRIAWECQIFDTSFHFIRNMNDGSVSSLSAPVSIGSHNWIGNRVNVMKGVKTPDYTIVGAGSLLTKKYDVPEYSLLAGGPAKLIKTGIYRCLDEEETQIKKQLKTNR